VIYFSVGFFLFLFYFSGFSSLFDAVFFSDETLLFPLFLAVVEVISESLFIPPHWCFFLGFFFPSTLA